MDLDAAAAGITKSRSNGAIKRPASTDPTEDEKMSTATSDDDLDDEDDGGDPTGDDEDFSTSEDDEVESDQHSGIVGHGRHRHQDVDIDDADSADSADEDNHQRRLAVDTVFENAVLYLRDALLVREFTDAIKREDSGRVVICLKTFALSYRGCGRTKYAHEMLHVIHNLTHVWPKPLR